MDPNLDKPTSFNLPAHMEGGNFRAPMAPETLPQQPELAVNPSRAVPATPASILPTTPVSDAATVAAAPSTASAWSTDAPTVADDTDLIEKEWVSRAKAIVEKTKEDPYTQNRELSRFKADYIQKRYNKEVKISE